MSKLNIIKHKQEELKIIIDSIMNEKGLDVALIFFNKVMPKLKDMDYID